MEKSEIARFVRPWMIAVAMFLTGTILSHVAGGYVDTHFRVDDPPLMDFVHDNVAPIDLNWLVTPTNVLVINLVLVYFFFFERERFPLALFSPGLYFAIRAACLVATQLPAPWPRIDDSWIIDTPTPMYFGQRDLFPSGHAGALFACLLHLRRTWWVKGPAMFMLALVSAGVVLMHVHYTIDVIGGLVMAYGVYSFTERHMERVLAHVPLTRQRSPRR